MYRYLVAAIACTLVAGSAIGAGDALAKRSPMLVAAAASMMSGTVIHLQSMGDSSLQQLVPGAWGKRLSGNSQAQAMLIEISSVSTHRHNGSAEFMYVLDGSAHATIGTRSADMAAGDLAYIPKGIAHSIQATSGKIKVLAFQVPPLMAGDMHFSAKGAMNASMASSTNAGESGVAGSVTHVQSISDDSLRKLIPGVWSKLLVNNARTSASLSEFSTVKPHWHNRVSHFYYVLDGSAQLTVGQRATSVAAGDFVYITKGVTHAVKSNGRKLKVLVIAVPPSPSTDMHYPTSTNMP